MRIMGFLHEDQCMFLILSHLVLHRMRNISDKSCRENENTLLYSIIFLKNHAIYGIMWKTSLETSKPSMTIWHLGIACWILKARNTLSVQ